MSDPAAEGEALVAGEGPDLAAAGRERGDVAGVDEEEEDDVEDEQHGGRARVVEEEEVGGRGGEGAVERAPAEEHCDEHDDAEQHVAEIGPPHAARHDEGGVFNFFADVHDAVGAEVAVHDGDLGDEAGGSRVAPAAVLAAHDPQRHDGDDEAGQVAEEGRDFEGGQDPRAPGVEEDGHDDEGEHDECVLPICEAV